jgi:hypothetical protein
MVAFGPHPTKAKYGARWLGRELYYADTSRSPVNDCFLAVNESFNGKMASVGRKLEGRGPACFDVSAALASFLEENIN